MSLLLPLVDFSVRGDVSSLAGLVRQVRGLLFWSTKDYLWQTAMGATETNPSSSTIHINRKLAQKLKDEGRCDVRAKDSYFGQLFRRLNHLPASTFRIGKSKRAWMIKFGQEQGIDAGGLYREANTLLCEELQTNLLPLFIPSPNNRESMGDNRDKWVPNPEAITPLHLSMYEFVGKMMGLAIRSRDLLNLDFPSILWKALIDEKITDEDVIAIDVLSFKIIDEMQKLEIRTHAQKDFDSVFADTKFTIAGSDAKEYETVPNGRFITLTWDNRKEFCEALVRYRQHEFDRQCAAIRRGIATVVPYTLLSLFTWKELEIQVCGRPTMNVDLLQKMTTYQGVNEKDLHVRFFWDVIRNRFDELERAKFLKFVWGRSRLPVREQDFETKFKITQHAASVGNPDAYMPVAHTCFFSVEMPAYTNAEVMYNRLIYAITHCTSFEMA